MRRKQRGVVTCCGLAGSWSVERTLVPSKNKGTERESHAVLAGSNLSSPGVADAWTRIIPGLHERRQIGCKVGSRTTRCIHVA
jgi:hypothetical protein